MFYLLRHAKAGDRGEWEGDDRLRPLTRGGLRQAKALVDVYDGFPIDRTLSSPYVRCVQTVQPLAERRKLAIEETDALAEGAGLDSLLELMNTLSGQHSVLCTHGDLIWELLDYLVERSILPSARPTFAKGSTWVLEEVDGEPTSARYLPPP